MLKDNHTFTQLAIALMGFWPVQTICSHARRGWCG